MIKKLVVITGMFICQANVFAQTSYVDSLINWVNTHPKVDSVYIQNLHRISYRLSEKDIRRSFDYYEKVAFFSDSIHFVYGKSLAQINLGILFSNSANFAASNHAFVKAIEYAESCGALRLKAISLNNIADNYNTLKDLERCRQYTLQAIDINSRLKAWRGVAINYELLARRDFGEKLYADAKKDLMTGMPFAMKANENYIFSQFYLDLGKLQAVAQHNDSAVFYFNKAMDQAKPQNDLRNEAEVCIARAQYLTGVKPALQLQWLKEALRIADETGYRAGVSTATNQLFLLYDKLKNKDSSFFYYTRYRIVSDSLFSETNRTMVTTESELLIRQQQRENHNLKELAKLQSGEIAAKDNLLIAMMISALLLTAILFFIRRSGILKKKRDAAALKQKIAETQILAMRAKMNPHFIFNSLNSIENFMLRNEKRQASDYLNKFSKFIRNILDSGREGLVSFASDMDALQLYIDLEQLRYNNKFSYHTFIDPFLLSGRYQVPSLLVQPYLENAIMHGIVNSEKNGLKLVLKASREKDVLIYTIEDNGIGWKRSAMYNLQNKPGYKSSGLKIAADRIHIFNEAGDGRDGIVITDLYDENNEPCGTRVSITIKLIEYADIKGGTY